MSEIRSNVVIPFQEVEELVWKNTVETFSRMMVEVLMGLDQTYIKLVMLIVISSRRCASGKY